MSEQNYVIEKILSDAKEKSDTIIADAKKASAEALLTAKKEIAKTKEEELQKAKNAANLEAQINTIRETTEKRIGATRTKSETINRVFASAKQEILNLSDKDYKNFIQKLIIANCKNGDTVIVSNKDQKILNDEFIKSVSASTKKKLTRTVGSNFNGGVILSNDNYDAELTLDELFKDLREDIEAEVANLLFGE